MMLHLIHNSVRTFTGEDKAYPVTQWVRDIEGDAEIYGWTAVQKLLVARRSLAGLAELWRRSEETHKTWDALKAAIVEWFADAHELEVLEHISSTCVISSTSAGDTAAKSSSGVSEANELQIQTELHAESTGSKEIVETVDVDNMSTVKMTSPTTDVNNRDENCVKLYEKRWVVQINVDETTRERRVRTKQVQKRDGGLNVTRKIAEEKKDLDCKFEEEVQQIKRRKLLVSNDVEHDVKEAHEKRDFTKKKNKKLSDLVDDDHIQDLFRIIDDSMVTWNQAENRAIYNKKRKKG